MRTLRSIQFSAAALLTGSLWQAHAAYQAVDTFNALNLGAIGSQNGWVVTAGDTTTSTVAADPAVPSNKVLRHFGTNDAYKPLPAPIADASGGTLFFRVRIEDLANDVSFGLSYLAAPSMTNFPDYEVQGNATGTAGAFGSRDGGTNRSPVFNMTAGVWYNVWYVVDTTADTYRLYVQSDGHSAYATQTEIVSSDGTWNFRNPAVVNPLRSFLVMSNNSNTGIYIDDIYVDTLPTPNLVNPTTEIDTDLDDDGLDDTWEIFYFDEITAQDDAGDPDGDGFTNLQEFTAGSNPDDTASTPDDIDGDGLADAWEVTNFGNTTSQTGAGDFDGDGATNLAEQAAGTNPANAGSWPDTDNDGLRDAWELSYFPLLTTANGSGDADSDGFSNLAEMQAGSSPTNSQWTPNQAALAHRWSFNGDLNDSVGGSNATLYDLDNDPATGGTSSLDTNAVTLTGGASATSTAVRLGGNLVGGGSTPVTIQLWATPNAVQNWGRIFDFGSGTTEYLFMSWSRTTSGAQDRVEWVDGANVGVSDTNAPYTLGTQYHIVLTLTPAAYTNGALATGTRVTWYTAPASSASTVVAKGTFDTASTLANLNDVDNFLGRSMWPGDNVAAATYDEVRIWDGALTATSVNTYQLAGPNAFSIIDTDSDGLSDLWEEAFFDNLAQGPNGDPDSDGFTNLQEYNAGSNPNVTASTPSDTDGDGLPDNWEIQNFGNLAQGPDGDADGDGATNLEEYDYRLVGPFFFSTNPTDPNSWPDSDFDNLNDSWEMLNFGDLAQTYEGDFDSDGYSNGFEYQNNLDPTDDLSSPDGDVDGLPDGWEIRYFMEPGEDSIADLNTILARTSGTDDPDADGFNNSLELAYLTDPDDITSVPGDLNDDGINDGPVLKLGGDILGTESFTNGLNWHDGLAPVAGKTYIVGFNGLRSPEATSDYTFAGDRLALINVGTNLGTLIWKNTGALTIPVLEMRGGRINQAAVTSSTVTLNGTVVVSGPAEIWANNGNFLINSAVSGDSDLTLTGNGLVTFAGAVTSTGDLVVNVHSTAAATNRLTLATTGSIEFTLGAEGATNVITGAGVITLNGALVIDSSAVTDATLGEQWSLLTTTAARTFGSTFSVTGYASDGGAVGARKWTSLGTAPYFQFDEATGVLTVVTNPDSDNDGLIDSWEILYFEDLSRDGTADSDNDGSTDMEEFLAGTNPTDDSSWPDTDNDGVKDSYELATFGNLTTATATDRDGDTLPDAWELTYFASIETQGPADDSDNDSFSNSAELTARSNPALAASVPGDINADGVADGQRLLVGDTGGTNSFVNGLNWADALAPSAGKNYFVDVNSLRSPNDTGAYSFAGDRLVIYTGGNLLVKGSGVLTFPLLNLDGGQLHNGTDANVLVTVEGAINVTRASTIFAQNQGFVLNASLSGTGNLGLTGANVVTIAGTNTWRGNLALTNTGGFVLAQTGNLVFAPGANGVSNAITGTNPAVLNGTFNIDTSAASTAPGASWVLVATSGAKTYGATFSVSGYVADSGAVGVRKWTSGEYTFDEATGTLSVAGAPASGLADWRQTYFETTANAGEAADAADPDADGRPNLLEYALGTDPTEADSGAPVVVAVQAGVLTLSFDHIADPTLTYVVEASDNLANWDPVQTYTGLDAAGTITYTDTVVLSPAAPRRFLRLEVATAP